MSNVPPPPPPPFGGNVPPAPPNPGGYAPPPAYTPPPASAPQPGYGQYPQAPAGYQPYPQSPGTGRVESAKGLRTATIVAFWTMTIASAFIAFAMFSRKSTVDDFINGDSSIGFQELDDADSLVGAAVLLSWLAQLFAVIMVCLWAGKIVRNAQARGVQGLSPGMAVGGWWIPIGWYWLGFQQLSKSVKGLNRSAPSLKGWQIAFIIAQIGSGVLYAVRTDFDGGDLDDFAGKLSRQGFISAGSAVLFLVATLLAMKATKEIDTAVCEA